MRQKGFKRLGIILSLLLLVIISVVALNSSDGFTITGFTVDNAPTVYNAQFLSAECVERVESMSLVDIGEVDKNGEFFPCTTISSGTYIPIEEQCDFTVIEDSFVRFKVYDCPAGVDNEDDLDRCVDVSDGVIENTRSFSIRQGHSLFVDTRGIFGTGLGTVDITARYPSYGLQVEDETGSLKATTESCVLESLPNGYQTLDLSFQTVIAPDIPFNVVTGLVAVKSSRVVDLNGQLVYVLNAGEYYSIIATDNSDLIVDTVSGVKTSSEIECIPSVKCSRDAKLIDTLEGQDADLLGGTVSGYAPVSGDSSILCKYEVIDGKLSLTDDCINKVVCDDPSKPSFDPYTGQCVALEDITELSVIDEKTIFWLVLIAGALLIVLIAVLVRVYSPSKKKKVVKRGRR